MKATFADILQQERLETVSRMESKIPQWAGIPGLEFPTDLCTQQCSSSAAALIKAEQASMLHSGRVHKIADLTAGIGVDCWAFATAADARVLHNEMDRKLSAAARHNFGILGISEIEFSNEEIGPDNVGNILKSFFKDEDPAAALCYLDPARRSRTGTKVFRISDCTPDILQLIPMIRKTCRHIMVKLSPMADIGQCIKEFESAGARCRKAMCIGIANECKELLFILDSEYEGDPVIEVRDDDFTMKFTKADEETAQAIYPSDSKSPGEWLFEPGKALAKSGAFKLTSSRWGLTKLAPSTQLYCSSKPIQELTRAGKWFKIIDNLEFSSANIKVLSSKYRQCEISTRNVPVSSDELRRRMKAKSGGLHHIFAVGILNEKRILITQRQSFGK